LIFRSLFSNFSISSTLDFACFVGGVKGSNFF